jgi:SRSO17 transposase
MRRDAEHQPISVKDLALNLPASAWRKVTWREGAAAPLSSRFARVRIHVADRDYKLTEPYPEEWLLIERPNGEKEPTKYWLSTLPEDISFRRLVDCAKLRWRIEHDYRAQARGRARRLRRARVEGSIFLDRSSFAPGLTRLI